MISILKKDSFFRLLSGFLPKRSCRPCIWKACALALLFGFAACGGEVLLVCIPGKQNALQIQRDLDIMIGPGKAMAFGRIKDLEARLSASPDAAVIATEAFFTYVPGYKPFLKGKTGNRTGEKFFVVTASKEVTKDNFQEKRVGVVDFLGHDRLPRFIKDQFNVEIKTLKKTNKEEDLLIMIGIEAADAIIVSASAYEEILSNTKLPLRIVATSMKNVGFAECAFKEGKEMAELKNTLLKAPVSFRKEIGIDSWEIR